MRISFLGVLTGLALLAASTAHAQLITNFDEYADGTQDVMFRQPSFSGSTSSLLAADPNTTAVTSEKAFSSPNSDKANWAWKDTADTNWLRLTTYKSPILPNPTIDFNQQLTMKVYLDGPSPLGIALTVRETGKDVPIGADGGISGTYEFVGSTTPETPTPTHIVTPGSWQDLTFNFATDPIAKFVTGDGILSSPNMKGTIDSLAIRSAGQTGPYALYIDDVQVIPAGGAIPEPGTVALLASGLLPLLGLRRRKA